MSHAIPILGFAAASGTGKTTLMVNVIEQLHQAGVRIAAIKHGHHPAEADVLGKDSFRFRQAGAETVLFSSPQRWFLIQELHNRHEPTLEEQVFHLKDHDLILLEGYKHGDHPKIVVHRIASGQTNLHEQLTHVIAIASDDPKPLSDLPQFSLEDAPAIATFIQNYFNL